jgi:hypothetical protein
VGEGSDGVLGIRVQVRRETGGGDGGMGVWEWGISVSSFVTNFVAVVS